MLNRKKQVNSLITLKIRQNKKFELLSICYNIEL